MYINEAAMDLLYCETQVSSEEDATKTGRVLLSTPTDESKSKLDSGDYLVLIISPLPAMTFCPRID